VAAFGLGNGERLVIRSDQHDRGGAVILGVLRQPDRLPRAAGTGVRNNRDPACGLVDDHFDDMLTLRAGQRRELTRRSAWNEPVDARIDGAINERSQTRLINFLLCGERGRDRGVHTSERLSHALFLPGMRLSNNGNCNLPFREEEAELRCKTRARARCAAYRGVPERAAGNSIGIHLPLKVITTYL
jgi:hypothetical protein